MYAQLWRDDLPDDPIADAPHVGIGPRIPTVSGLVQLIAAATEVEPGRVDQLPAES
ncbi:hypothetical protein ACFQVD_12690 [Streptosporangium amethystogenes subsp. fukuiense]|uniref:Uncharacterized protein n=1 Tax=Streptosporangium amethystogenes subsp. fukuiense TaxID=698418 RepID=A0ABW2SZ51_9ACTN